MSENEKLGRTEDKLPAPAPATSKPEKPSKDKSAKETKKNAKNAKPGFFARIGKWFREMKSELKKVQWPTAKQTINNTLIVLLCCVVVGVFIWAFDWLAQSIISALLALFGK